MKKSGIKLTEDLKSTYLRYLKSAYKISNRVYAEQFSEELERTSGCGLINGPLLQLTPDYKKSVTIEELIDKGIISSKFRELSKGKVAKQSLYIHQEQAINKLYNNDENIIVSTGTGSGKTESFLYPILNSLFKEKEKEGYLNGLRVLIIYPMNALVNDQKDRLEKMLDGIDDISYAVYTGDTEEKERKQIRKNPPNILITNYVMLEYLMLRPEDRVMFTNKDSREGFKYIVLDEAHSYTGTHAVEISMLLRRFTELFTNKSNIRFAITSATLADDENDVIEFMKRLCAGYVFKKDSIIRSVIYDHKNNSELRMIDANEIINIYDQYGEEKLSENQSEELYNVMVNVAQVHEIKKILKDDAVSFVDVAEQVNLEESSLSKFLLLCKKAKIDSNVLLDTKYHVFIRALEGVYVSFGNDKLSVTRRNEDEGYKFYEISVCEYCGDIYIHGNIIDGEFSQTNNDDFYSADKFYVVTEKLSTEEIRELYSLDDYNIYSLCTKCNHVSSINSAVIDDCACDTKKVYLLQKKDNNDEKTENKSLKECVSCKTINVNQGVLRAFYSGSDASSSVIASALYDNINYRIIESEDKTKRDSRFSTNSHVNQKIKKVKQFLAFSDSVREASYFAHYFQKTYDEIKVTRNVFKQINEYGATDGHINLNSLFIKIKNSVNAESSFDDNSEEFALYSLLKIVTDTRINSMTRLGMIDFDFNIDWKIFTGFDPKEKMLFYAIIRYMKSVLLKNGAINYNELHGLNLSSEQCEELYYTKRQKMVTEENVNKKNKYAKVQLYGEYKSEKSSKLYNIFNKYEVRDENERKEIFRDIKEEMEYAWKIISNTQDKGIVVDMKNVNVSTPYTGGYLMLRCNKCGDRIFICKETNEVLDIINNQYKCEKNKCYGVYEYDESQSLKYFDRLSDNHYFNIYTNEKIERMNVEEHTSQIGRKIGKEHQESFVKGDTNVISSTTTFEMGIDLGSLETVFMRNVPPLPANYIQRAGRAGRSSDSIAYVVTFAKMSNHDFHFFSRPNNMINGKVINPPLKLNNEKIFSRHANVYLLSLYWEHKGKRERKTNEFFNNFCELESYMLSNQSDLNQKVDKLIDDNIISNHVDAFINCIKHEEQKYRNEIAELQELKSDKTLSDDERRNVGYKLANLDNEKIIDRLVLSNILPKYGFPVDVVELKFDYRISGTNNLSAQKSIVQAISDYAPDNEIVINKRIFTSRYIVLENQWREKANHSYVSKCLNEDCDNVTLSTSDNVSKCSECGSDVEVYRYIEPINGFKTEVKFKTALRSKPRTSFRTDVLYVGDSKNNEDAIICKSDDKLYIENVDSYYVCNNCGYATKSAAKIEELKKNDTSGSCIHDFGEDLQTYKIGTIIMTDTVKINIGAALTRKERLSSMYALKETLVKKLGCGVNDLGAISRTVSGETELIFYDSVPGGAGYCKKIEGILNDFDQRNFIFNNAIEFLNSCSCGTEIDNDIACYSCLYDYWNSRVHDEISKKNAISGLNKIRSVLNKY